MDKENARELMEKGIDFLEKGWADDAVPCFQEVLENYQRNAAVLSWLGLAIARTRRGDMRPAEKYCLEAIEKEYFNVNYYRNLAEVYVIWEKKKKAIKTLKKGLAVDKGNDMLKEELCKLGVRQKPVIPFLSRTNPVNRYLGEIRSRIGS